MVSLWALCCLLLIPFGARADRADTTIADQTYALLPAADLLSRLQRAQEPIHLRATAVVGPLYAPTAGLDTVRAALHLDDVFFFDEVTLNNVVFLGPVQGERTTFASGLSLTNAHFHRAFGLRASRSGKHLNCKQAVFRADADFTDGNFAGPNSFINARFAGAARFARTHFATAAYFEAPTSPARPTLPTLASPVSLPSKTLVGMARLPLPVPALPNAPSSGGPSSAPQPTLQRPAPTGRSPSTEPPSPTKLISPTSPSPKPPTSPTRPLLKRTLAAATSAKRPISAASKHRLCVSTPFLTAPST